MRLADRLEQVTCRTRITPEDRAFIESRDMFFLATADAAGRPNCSYKGGDPGFVRVIDETTIVFPNYDGNGMFLSFGNATVNPHVGLLFIDFESPKRLRLNGEAAIIRADPSCQRVKEAQFVVRVKVRELFPNCPRYIHKYQLVERSSSCRAPGLRHRFRHGSASNGRRMCCRQGIRRETMKVDS